MDATNATNERTMNTMSEMSPHRDAVDLLTADHREVDRLFISLEGLQGMDSSGNTANADFIQLDQNLSLHALAEENVFYPELKSHAETADLVPEAYTEHQEMKEALAKMRGLQPASKEFQSLLKTLKNEVQHHVTEEENEMFVEARKVLGGERLEELGRQIQQFKDREKQQITAAGAVV